MSIAERFKGTGVALITPFKKNLEVDFDALEKMIDYVIADGAGVDYIVALGTTGESATLRKEEKQEIFQCIRLHTKKRVPLVAGIGGNDTADVLSNIEHFTFDGYDAVLSVSPYYNKPSQEGIFRHYRAVSTACPVPVIVYNVPPRTASNISADTSIRISHECENILGIKEASGDLAQCMKIVKHCRKGFLVLSGEDLLTVPMISFGMHGVISVLANALPKQFSKMTRLAMNADFRGASEILHQISDLDKLMYAEGNPVGVKSLLAVQEIVEPHVRLPLVAGSEKLVGDIQTALKSFMNKT